MRVPVRHEACTNTPLKINNFNSMIITPAFLISFLLVACNRKERHNLPVENNYLHSVSLTDVKVEGEIGRRIDSTINNNLLKISIAKDFILPFTE